MLQLSKHLSYITLLWEASQNQDMLKVTSSTTWGHPHTGIPVKDDCVMMSRCK